MNFLEKYAQGMPTGRGFLNCNDFGVARPIFSDCINEFLDPPLDLSETHGPLEKYLSHYSVKPGVLGY